LVFDQLDEAILAVVRLLADGFNSGNVDQLDDILDPAMVTHTPIRLAPGAEGFKDMLAKLHSAFPGGRVSMESVFTAKATEGTTVVWRWRVVGSHLGDYYGIPPTGHDIDLSGVDMEVIREGRIVEHWSFWDRLALLEQLGRA
jgi:predicted ester cyclase